MNPALPAGADGILLSTRADAWALSAQLAAGWVSFPSRGANGQPFDDPTRARLDLGLATLMAGFGRGTGLGVEVQLPFGLISRSDLVNGSQTDPGLGDLEARARFSVSMGRVRLQGMAGLALPTGAYAARSGDLALLENARYLTLGRGTVWALADVDARFTLPASFGAFVTSTARLPLTDARDGFRWGPEVRATAGLTVGPLAGRVSFALGLETQWRAQSLEVDPFTSTLVPSVNTGGVWLTATPSAQLRVVDGLVVFMAGRLPVFQRVEGLQFLPSLGLFAGVGGSFELGGRAKPSVVVEKPATGQVTVVDYWATWCEPCLRLKPVIDALEAREPRIVVRRIDASEFTADLLEAMAPGAIGLPLVEVYGVDGSLRRRLTGEDVFQLEAVVKEALQ